MRLPIRSGTAAQTAPPSMPQRVQSLNSVPEMPVRPAREAAEHAARDAGRPVQRRILRSGLPDVRRKAEQRCAGRLRRVREQNRTEYMSRRDCAVICRLMPDGCSGSRITDGMDPAVKRESKAGMLQKHRTCLPGTACVPEEDLLRVPGMEQTAERARLPPASSRARADQNFASARINISLSSAPCRQAAPQRRAALP